MQLLILVKRTSYNSFNNWLAYFISLFSYFTLQDYMDDVHKKEITLMHTTVKIPGLRPRTTKTIPNYPAQHPNQEASNGGLKGDINHVVKGVCVVMLGSYRKDLFLLYLILIISTDTSSNLLKCLSIEMHCVISCKKVSLLVW
jgi:hypothetical protein